MTTNPEHIEITTQSMVMGDLLRTAGRAASLVDLCGKKFAITTVESAHVGHAYFSNAKLTEVFPVDCPWTGAGLPPVGTVCIVKPHNTQWGFSSVAGHERTVLAYHGEFVWLGQGDVALETTRIDKVDFLPLRTPEQIAAEEREKAVEQMVKCIAGDTTGVGMADAMICAKALYDAGYRRQEPKE